MNYDLEIAGCRVWKGWSFMASNLGLFRKSFQVSIQPPYLLTARSKCDSRVSQQLRYLDAICFSSFPSLSSCCEALEKSVIRSGR